MPDNKKHHFVPRFYLRRFSADGKSIQLYNIASRKRVSHASLRNEAYRDYFYGKEKAVEEAIAGIEGEAARIFRKIDQYQFLPPPFSPDHMALVTYVVMQQARTEYEAQALNEINDALMQQLLAQRAAAEGIDLRQFKINLADPGAVGVAIGARISPLGLDLFYKLLIDRTGVGFVTSDNPVVATNPLLSFRHMGSNCGLAAKGLQLYFPLDPDKLILFYDGAAYSVGSKRRLVVEITNPSDVHELNTLQMVSAGANIYFRGDQLNLEALHRKAQPFFRVRKSHTRVLKEAGTSDSERSEIIATSREDVRTNLSLSFVSVRTSTKKWREAARRERTQPAAEVRDPQLVEMFREFEEGVRKGRRKATDFLESMIEAYREAARRADDDEGRKAQSLESSSEGTFPT